MANNNYTPVEDGWKDARKPCYVSVENDHFDENSLVVELGFDFGLGVERPKAKLPLLYSATHVIAKWENGTKSEHKATAQDQRDAFAFLAELFPAWVKYNKQGGHTTQEMLFWFENDGRETVLATAMDIKVWHSTSGFPNATVKDPRNAKKAKPKVTKAEALTRAAAAFQQMFGVGMTTGVGTTAVGGAQQGAATAVKDDSDIPF